MNTVHLLSGWFVCAGASRRHRGRVLNKAWSRILLRTRVVVHMDRSAIKCGWILCGLAEIGIAAGYFLWNGSYGDCAVPVIAFVGMVISVVVTCISFLYTAGIHDYFKVNAQPETEGCCRGFSMLLLSSGFVFPWLSLGVWVSLYEVKLSHECYSTSKFSEAKEIITILLSVYIALKTCELFIVHYTATMNRRESDY